MRRTSENFLTMVNTTISVMNSRKSKWAGDGPIEEIMDTVGDAMTAISGARQDAGAAVSTGTTMDKDAAEAHALDLAMELAGYGMVYGRRTNNNTLREQMRAVKRKKLEDMDDDGLPDVLQDLYKRLKDLGKAAEKYGINETRMKNFQLAIDAYKPLVNTPRLVIVTRKGANSTIPAQLTIIRQELKDLDLLMESFAGSDPAFYTDYKNARIIIDRGGGQGGSGTPPAFPGS